ncbi:MAG: hypothetical protein C4538_08860 [Nitrospiraceae bacterium]|nr:MAG: hypothetical protein C4538_08860 [Nitrospiraceae bacterium]
MKSLLSVFVVALLLMSAAACKKKEEKPQPVPQQGSAPQGPIVESPMTQSPPPGHGTSGPKVEFQVAVPQEVKDHWSGVRFIIEDKEQNKKQELSATIGSEVKIPDSALMIKVGPFLPDFKMSGDTISSTTNDLINPAVGVIVYENGTKVFPASGQWGWLYMKFPTIHSFQHPRFAIALKEGIKK